MEFFRKVTVKTTENDIHQRLTLGNLDMISTEIFNLDEPGEHQVQIGGIWGEFTLTRNIIKGG